LWIVGCAADADAYREAGLEGAEGNSPSS
jgi:hypothetical protein